MMAKRRRLVVIGVLTFAYALMHLWLFVLGDYNGIPNPQQCSNASFQAMVPGLLVASEGIGAFVAVVFASVTSLMYGDKDFRKHWGALNVARWSFAVLVVILAALAYHWSTVDCLEVAITDEWMLRLLNALQFVPASIAAFCLMMATRESK